MTISQKIRASVTRIQDYAISYFEVLYKTIIQFWHIREIPSGANILTGGFAFLLIHLARNQISQPATTQVIGSILGVAILILLIICGILVALDPCLDRPTTGSTKVGNLRKLASVICAGIVLACAFIFLDSVIPWIDFIFGVAAKYELSTELANQLVAGAAAAAAFLIILVNSIYYAGLTSFWSPRNVVWSVLILAILVLGTNLLVGRTLTFS